MTDDSLAEANRQKLTFIVKPSIVDEGNFVATPNYHRERPAFGRGKTRLEALEDCVRTMREEDGF